MGKIEKALNRARVRQGKPGAAKTSRSQVAAEVALRRSVLAQNDGAKWIESLRIESTTSSGSEESKILHSDTQDEGVRSAYKMLRTRALRRMRENDWHVIGVTSASQGDGKSLTSINLSLSLAREPTLSVVLLELDLRRPSIARQFGVEPSKGLSDYLDGKAELKEVLFRPEGTERLAILPNLVVYEDSSEILSSPKMAALVAELRRSDPNMLIICDLPPYLATDDVLAFAPLTDAFIIVVSEGRTSRDVLAKGLDILQELPLLGVVLNRSEDHIGSYYY